MVGLSDVVYELAWRVRVPELSALTCLSAIKDSIVLCRTPVIEWTLRYSSLPACLPACLPAYMPAYMPACLPASLHACLPACLPACLMQLQHQANLINKILMSA